MVDDIRPILLTYAKCNWNDIDSVHIRGINIELTEDNSLHKTNDIEEDDLAEAWRKGFAAHAYAMTDPSYKVVNPYIQRS